MRPNARTVFVLICCAGLLAGGVGVSVANKGTEDHRAASVGSVRQADCADWKQGSEDQRETMVFYLRKFAGGPVGSSAGIQRGPVLDDDSAYKVLDSYCSKYFARGFKLYKLYGRAAAFVGH
jgi:hypothetical protein